MMETRLPFRGFPAHAPRDAHNGGFASPAEAPDGGVPRENATAGSDRLVVGVDFGTTYSG